MKSGYVAIIGRPNAGKSTLLNNLLKQKVSITSPKPQTTRFPVQAVYEDERGQIVFIDTPGVFAKVEDQVSRKINTIAQSVVDNGVDVVIYIVDHTRERDTEENKILGVLRTVKAPKILVINKYDIKSPSYLPHYKFMEDEFQATVTVSAFTRFNFNLLLDAIFEHLPEGEPLVENVAARPTPILNMDSRMYLGEIIREKAFLFLRKELPYSLAVIVDEIAERPNDTTYIRARIITTDDKYKSMIIGEKGRMIKEISMAARKELETATTRKIFLELTVETNRHWHEQLL